MEMVTCLVEHRMVVLCQFKLEELFKWLKHGRMGGLQKMGVIREIFSTIDPRALLKLSKRTMKKGGFLSLPNVSM